MKRTIIYNLSAFTTERQEELKYQKCHVMTSNEFNYKPTKKIKSTQ